jgi:hypothetical protein
MDVGWHCARIIERSNTNKPHQFSDTARQDQVIAPDRYLAFRAAGDSLIRAAWRWYFDIGDIALEKMYPVCLNQGVDGESRSVLALAPTAMAAVNDERPRFHSEAHVATGTATIVNMRLV